MKFVQRGLSVLLALALLMSGMALQGWAQGADDVDAQTQRIAGIYVVCEIPIVVRRSPLEQPIPKRGVHVMLSYVQPDEGAKIPDEEIPLENVTFPEETMVFDKIGYTEVPVEYEGFKASYPVYVDLNEPVAVRLRVVSEPEVKTYVVDDEIQMIQTAGLKVMVVYNNATEADVTGYVEVGNNGYYLFNKATEAEKLKMPIKYTVPTEEGSEEEPRVLTAYYEIEVVPEARLSIMLIDPPTDTRYFKADNPQTIDTAGMRVLASYGYKKANGDPVVLRTEVIDATDACYIKPVVLDTIGKKTITASLGDLSVTFDIIVDDAEVKLTSDGKPVGSTVKHKVAFLVPYRFSPLFLDFSYNKRMTVSKVEWSVSENGRMRIQDGKVTMRGLFAGTGKVSLVVTDNHGGVHLAETRVIFYKLDSILKLFFGKYI